MNTKVKRAFVLFLLGIAIIVLSCKKENEVEQPSIDLSVSVNDQNVDLLVSQGLDSISCLLQNKVDYVFDVKANTNISDIKTVFYNYSNPAKPVAMETLVGGLPQGQKQRVTGVVYPVTDLRIKLVVKDQAGNEAYRTLIINIP